MKTMNCYYQWRARRVSEDSRSEGEGTFRLCCEVGSGEDFAGYE